MPNFAIKKIARSDVQSQLDRALDVCFLAILFLAPLLMGGRHPAGRLGYVVLISLALIVWTIRQALDPKARIRSSGAEWLVLLGLAILIIQLVHLPDSWLLKLAPNLPQLLPIWFDGNAGSAWDSWSQLSLYPNATRGALVMYVAYAALFLLVVQRIKSLQDIERFLRWMALAAISLAVLGIAQMLLSNGKFLWVYEHPSRDTFGTVKGPFANANHFAHFLALGIGPLVWWLWRKMNARRAAEAGQRQSRSRQPAREQSARGHDGSRRSAGQGGRRSTFSASGRRVQSGRQDYVQMLLWLALPIVAIAGLLTFSRGGVIVLGIATAVVLSTYMLTKLFGRRSLLVLAGLGAVVIAALFIYGLDRLSGEMESVTDGSIDRLDTNAARRKLWAADFNAFRDFALLGTGAATHREIYPTYYEDYHHVEYTHAESGYVQILMECGVLGACTLILAIGLCLRWLGRCLKSTSDRRTRAIALAISAGILASLGHSLWDFVWYIPACITLTLMQVACLCRLSQLCQACQSGNPVASDSKLPERNRRAAATSHKGTTSKRNSRVQWCWVLAAIIAAVASFQMVTYLTPAAQAAPYWDRYASLVFAVKAGANADDRQTSVAAAIPDLETACNLDPNNARAHLKLAALYLNQFELNQQSAPNPMSLDQIRQAVAVSQFASVQQQQQWLSRAVGANQSLLYKANHFARRAATLSPFQGEAYVHLSRLDFLRGGDAKRSNDLLTQALRVRPHHGGVLIAAATNAALGDNPSDALNFLRQAFRQGPNHQRRVIETLAGNLPAEYFLDQFQPDLAGLQQLFNYYRKAQRREDAEVIARPYLDQLAAKADDESNEAAARMWFEAHRVYDYVDEKGAMLSCLERAVELMPNDFGLRKTYAVNLANHGSSEAAITQIRWCLRRKPDDPALKQIMKNVTGKKIRESTIAKFPDDREEKSEDSGQRSAVRTSMSNSARQADSR